MQVGLAVGTSVSVTDLRVLLLLPQSIKLPATDSLTKICFDSLFLNSFYVVNGILFTAFFLRIHNFKKPYNITSFNRKKALIEKDTQNIVVLILLPKIDILGLTETSQRKNFCQAGRSARCISLTCDTVQSRGSCPPPLRTSQRPCVFRLRPNVQTVSEWVPKH